MGWFATHTGYLKEAYDYAEMWAEYARDRFDDAQVHWLAAQDHEAIQDIITGCINLTAGIHALTDKYSGVWPYYRLCKILTLCWEYDTAEMPEYELTANKIAEAWMANDFEGRAITIAMIDRMRQIIWDEPFNVQWAARPEEQEF